jgi:hypothetical protein
MTKGLKILKTVITIKPQKGLTIQVIKETEGKIEVPKKPENN